MEADRGPSPRPIGACDLAPRVAERRASLGPTAERPMWGPGNVVSARPGRGDDRSHLIETSLQQKRHSGRVARREDRRRRRTRHRRREAVQVKPRLEFALRATSGSIESRARTCRIRVIWHICSPAKEKAASNAPRVTDDEELPNGGAARERRGAGCRTSSSSPTSVAAQAGERSGSSSSSSTSAAWRPPAQQRERDDADGRRRRRRR